MAEIREAAHEEAVFRIEGRFDQDAALRLRQRLLVEEPARAVLDFSHVENFDDAALPFLTVILTILRRNGRAVALLGLRSHQVPILEHFDSPTRGGSTRSAEVRLRQVDELVAAAAEHSAQHVEAEASDLLDTDRWRHRELLPMDGDIDERRAIMGEGARQGRPQILGAGDPDAQD
jgi:anti-anti-sigma regulatory factor